MKGEHATLTRWRSCVVLMKGKDGEIHSVSVTATSLFDAADQAARIWHQLWWYARSFKIHVEDYEGRTWNVTPERLHRWRESKSNHPPAGKVLWYGMIPVDDEPGDRDR